MRNSTTNALEHRNDNIATVFGAIFIGTGVLTLISRIFDVTPNPLWLVGLGLVAIGYLGVKRAAATIDE